MEVGSKKILANIAWLFLDRFLRMTAGLLVGVWIARYLGPDRFGLLSYAQAFAAVFSAMASMGLDGIVVRNIVRDPAGAGETLGSAFMLKLAGGFLTLLMALGAISLLHPQDTLTFWLVGIIAAGSVFQAFDAIDLWFQAKVASKYSVYAKNAAFLIVSGVKVHLILNEAPLLSFAWAGLAEVIIGAAGLLAACRARGCSFTRWRASVRRGAGLLRDSWPLIFSSLVIMVYMRIDQIMIKEMLGDREAGIYSAAVRLVEAWYFVPMAIVPSVFPSIVEARKICEDLFYSRLQNLYNLMALLAYAVAIPAFLLSGWLAVTLYGGGYREAGPILALYIWSILFTNLGVARSSFLTAVNWTRVHFITTLAGCIINILLNYLMIPKYGGLGAAAATLVSYWFASHGACLFYRPLHRTGAMMARAMIMPVPGRMR